MACSLLSRTPCARFRRVTQNDVKMKNWNLTNQYTVGELVKACFRWPFQFCQIQFPLGFAKFRLFHRALQYANSGPLRKIYASTSEKEIRVSLATVTRTAVVRTWVLFAAYSLRSLRFSAARVFASFEVLLRFKRNII